MSKHTPWFADNTYVFAGIKRGKYALDREPTPHIATAHVSEEGTAAATAQQIASDHNTNSGLLAALERLYTVVGEALIDNQLADQDIKDAHDQAFAAIAQAKGDA